MKPEPEIRGVILTVYGKVQGVGFRFYTQRRARELQVKGFVQNRPDGSVYIEAEGSRERLGQFIAWCGDGPPWARVSEVKEQFVPARGFDDFSIR